MYTLDANIFLRDANQRDAAHAVCHGLLSQIHRAGLSLIEPFIVLSEVAGTLSRIYRDPMRGRIYVDILRALQHVSFVPVDGTLAEEAAEIAADYALRGMNAIYVAVARQHGWVFVTLDAEIGRRVGALITVQTREAALNSLIQENQ